MKAQLVKVFALTQVISLGLNLACNREKAEPDTGEPHDAAFVSSDSQKSEIDASNRNEWVGFDLDTGTYIKTAEFAADPSWDLAFKRTSIKLHGSEVQLLKLKDQDFDALEQAPADGYIIDQPSSEAGAKETTGLAFHRDEEWYNYDATSHLVSPKNILYVIKSNSGQSYKLKITDYYNAERLPSLIQVQWQKIP